MNKHLVEARTDYTKELTNLDDKKDALSKCEAAHKIKIPKKGKVPKAITDEINKDCAKELAAIKLAHIPYVAANKEYSDESIAYKKKFGGDDFLLCVAFSLVIVCCCWCCAFLIKRRRHEKGQDSNFNHDDYVKVIDSEHA